MRDCSHHFRDAFEAQGEMGYFTWVYGHNDKLDVMLQPNYFHRMSDRLRVGDLIFAGTTPNPARPHGSDNSGGEIRRCLLMVAANDRSGVRVRLVQDFGRPDDPCASTLAAAPAASPRRRSRPRAAAADAPASD